MFDKDLAYSLTELIVENLEIILNRTKEIHSPKDFTSSETGMILLDSVCMKLAAVGESVKNLDKVTKKELLIKYKEVQWKLVMGMRDIIVHHYFDIDAEEIFKTIKEDLPGLIATLTKIKGDLNTI